MQSSYAVSYFHSWLVWHYSIFPHYLKNGTIFENKVPAFKMCVLVFSKILSESFIIPRRIKRSMIINVKRSASRVTIMFHRF